MMPDHIPEALLEFERLIVWKTINTESNKRIEIPEPQPGVDTEFDQANELVNSIKDELDTYCKAI
jgi:hypothetical protein